jgi:hypothetical protein
VTKKLINIVAVTKYLRKKLKEEKVYFGSGFHRFQSKMTDSITLDLRQGKLTNGLIH